MSSGDAWVFGHSLKRMMGPIYSKIGYCPQEDTLADVFTGRETLTIFCLIKGVPVAQIDQVSNGLAESLGLLGHMDKQVRELGGGNRRKLSVAVAVLNRPRLLLMDEPTTGLDPSAKRRIWRVMSGHSEFGKSILFSSQSMEECEVLCTRLSILVKGQLMGIGTPQHLKARYVDGFMLSVHIDRTKTNLLEAGAKGAIARVQEFILTTFPGASLQ